MRVLDTVTAQFVEINPKETKYAILSHTWNRRGEQTYEELRDIQKRHAPSGSDNDSSFDDDDDSPAGDSSDDEVPTPGQAPSPIWDDPKLSLKVRKACRVARDNGYRYLWIDSCCIDKTSSSELSESINSMYQWYAHADVCYAFLPDVPAEKDHPKRKRSRFRRSRWFSRGWTLQELIAPVDVVFLAKDWTVIGSKLTLADLVTEITKIGYNALLHVEPLDEFSVAERLSWAAERETTRVEDRAYSLLGIFDINMPTLYGEGERAFRRLQEEIMRRTPDQSLFAWTRFGPQASSHLHDPETAHWRGADTDQARFSLDLYIPGSASLLAPSLKLFRKCAGIEMLSHDEVVRRLQLPTNGLPATDYDFTPYGIRVQLPVISFASSDYFPPERAFMGNIPLSQWYLVILGCGHKDFPGHLLGRVCYLQSSGSSIHSLYCGQIDLNAGRSGLRLFDLLPLSPATITRLHSESESSQISSKTLYIPQPERNEVANDPDHWKRHETIKLVLPKKTCDALSAQGYAATLRHPDDVHPTTHSLTLAHENHTITVDYKHTLEENEWDQNQMLTIEAHVKTSGPVLQDARGNLQVPQVDNPGPDTRRVSWTDRPWWKKALGAQDVELSIPGPTTLTVRLGLAFATKNHYLLRIELQTPDGHPIPPFRSVAPIEHEPDGRITI